jgi:hypothetical protein
LTSVPGLKVTVIDITPSLPATDFMYIMFSTPLIDSSSGVATVSALTLGLAPGYTARTATVGGTTSGYSLIGSSGSEIAPATKIRIDRTAAKIGRSTNRDEKFFTSAVPQPCRRRRPAGRVRAAHRPWR